MTIVEGTPLATALSTLLEKSRLLTVNCKVGMEPSGDDQVTHNEAVFLSESEHANRNRALAYFLKDAAIPSAQAIPPHA